MKNSLYFFLLWLVLGITACSVSNNAAFTPEKKYSPAALQEDLQVMEQTIRQNHPSLYWYSSPEEVDASFAKAYAAVKDSMNESAFQNLLNETLFVLRCGHTSVRHSAMYRYYQAGRRQTGFPLGLKIVDDSTLVITGNSNRRDSVLKRGMTILSINGRTARALIDTMLPLVPIDGHSKNFSYQNLSNNFPQFYNSFFQQDTIYQLQYIDYNDQLQQITIRPYDPAKDTSRFRRPVTTGPFPAEPDLSFRQRRQMAIRSFAIDTAHQTAALRISSFTRGLQSSYIKKIFRELRRKNISNLIIDVRNNGGGLIRKSLLLTKYIKQEPFIYSDSVYSAHRKIKTDARVKKKFWNNLGMLLLNKKINDSVYVFKYFHHKSYEPQKQTFKGNVYVLTGGFSFSATTMFLSSIKGQQNVTLVGEETGGGYYGNNGVFIPELVLPHTKLQVRLPMYRIVNNKNITKNGSGVLPDVEVKATAETIRYNRDPKVEAVHSLIARKKKAAGN